MNWIEIRNNQPPKNEQVLFEVMNDIGMGKYHTGYWDEFYNCMKQFSDEREGWSYTVKRWCYITGE